jgi:hypothetical protein
MKVDRERRELEEIQQRKKQEEEMLRKHRSQMELMKQQVGTSLRGPAANAVHAPQAPSSQAEAARRAQLVAGKPSAQGPIVGGTSHPQVNISHQAARMPAVGTANMTVPSLGQGVPLSAGMHVNMQSFRRLSPQQQQQVYAQMQARQMQVAQAQAQQQQQQQQQQSSPHPQPTMPMPGGVTAGQTPPHPQAHSLTEQPQTHTSPHHQTHISPPRHGTPSNGGGLVNMGANALVRPTSSQHPQPPRPGPTPHVQPQPPRPGSSQHPQPQPLPARQGTSQQQQQQQQQAIHHFMQNAHAAGMTPELKRLYQNPIYWVSVQLVFVELSD